MESFEISNRCIRSTRVLLLPILMVSLISGCSSDGNEPVIPSASPGIHSLEALNIFRTATDLDNEWKHSPFMNIPESRNTVTIPMENSVPDRDPVSYRGGWFWQDVSTEDEVQNIAVIDPQELDQKYPDSISANGYTYNAWIETKSSGFTQVKIFKHRDNCVHSLSEPDYSDESVSFDIPNEGINGPRLGLSQRYVSTVLVSEYSNVIFDIRNKSHLEDEYDTPIILPLNNDSPCEIKFPFCADLTGHSFMVDGVSVDVFYIVASVFGSADGQPGYGIVGWTVAIPENGDPVYFNPSWIIRPGTMLIGPTKTLITVDDTYCHIAWISYEIDEEAGCIMMVSGALPASFDAIIDQDYDEESVDLFNQIQASIWTLPYDIAKDADIEAAAEYPNLSTLEIDADQNGNLAVAYLAVAESSAYKNIGIRWFRDGNWTSVDYLGLESIFPGTKYPIRCIDMEYDNIGTTHLAATLWEEYDPYLEIKLEGTWYIRHNGTFWEYMPQIVPWFGEQIWNVDEHNYYWQTVLAVTANYDCEFVILGKNDDYSNVYFSRSSRLSGSDDQSSQPALNEEFSLVEILPWNPLTSGWQDPWEDFAGFGGPNYQIRVDRRHAMNPDLSSDCLQRVNAVWSEYWNGAFWLEGEDPVGGEVETVHFRRQFNNGNQWSKPIWLNHPRRYPDEYVDPQNQPRPACNPVITSTNDGRSFVAWQELINSHWSIILDGEYYDNYFNNVITADPLIDTGLFKSEIMTRISEDEFDFYLPSIAGRSIITHGSQALVHGVCMFDVLGTSTGIAYVRFLNETPLFLRGRNIGSFWPHSNDSQEDFNYPTERAIFPDICTVPVHDYNITSEPSSREAVILAWIDEEPEGPVIAWGIHYEPADIANDGIRVLWDQIDTVHPQSAQSSIVHISIDPYSDNQVRVVYTLFKPDPDGFSSIEAFNISYNESTEVWDSPSQGVEIFSDTNSIYSGLDVSVDGAGLSHILLNAMLKGQEGGIFNSVTKILYLKLPNPGPTGFDSGEYLEGPIDLTRWGWRNIYQAEERKGNFYYPPVINADSSDVLHFAWMQDHMVRYDFVDGYRPFPITDVFTDNPNSCSIEYHDGLFLNTGF